MVPVMQSDSETLGLCFDCVNAKVIRSDRGSEFYLCKLSGAGSPFPKYPRLPVRICNGYERIKASAEAVG